MWIEWFIRYSTSIRKWSLKFVCDECKRHRYMLSFSPLLFIINRKFNKISLNKYNEENQWRYYRNKYRTQSTLFASSIIGALASAAAVFSWENDGITDEEL